jgi:hypothetical protein
MGIIFPDPSMSLNCLNKIKARKTKTRGNKIMDIESIQAHHEQELIVHQWATNCPNQRYILERLDIPNFVDFLLPQHSKDLRLIVDYAELDAMFSSYLNFYH